MKVRDHIIIKVISKLTVTPYESRYTTYLAQELNLRQETLYLLFNDFSSKSQDLEHYFIKESIGINNKKVYKVNWRKLIYDFLNEMNRLAKSQIIPSNFIRKLEFNKILKLILLAVFRTLAKFPDLKLTFSELYLKIARIITLIDEKEFKWLILTNVEESIDPNNEKHQEVINKLKEEYQKLLKSPDWKDFQKLREILIMEQPFSDEWEKELWMYFPIVFGLQIGLKREIQDIFNGEAKNTHIDE